MFFLKNHTEKIRIDEVKEGEIYAPVSGKVIPLEQVNDAVFSQKMLGEGAAVEPDSGTLYAPAKGRVSVVFPTGHVVGIETEDGANVIIHVGIDTVELKGKGFDVKVKQGDLVNPGDVIMRMDLPLIRKHYDATTMVVVEKSEDFKVLPVREGQVRAGEELLRLERIT